MAERIAARPRPLGPGGVDNEQRLLLLVCVMVPGITVVMAMHLFVPHVLIPEVNGVMSFIGKDEWRDATLD